MTSFKQCLSVLFALSLCFFTLCACAPSPEISFNSDTSNTVNEPTAPKPLPKDTSLNGYEDIYEGNGYTAASGVFSCLSMTDTQGQDGWYCLSGKSGEQMRFSDGVWSLDGASVHGRYLYPVPGAAAVRSFFATEDMSVIVCGNPCAANTGTENGDIAVSIAKNGTVLYSKVVKKMIILVTVTEFPLH